MLQVPPAAALPVIASVAAQYRDWAAAMTAARLYAVQHPQGAADMVADIVQGLSSNGSNVTPAAEGMPVLQKAECHAEVVKVHLVSLHMVAHRVCSNVCEAACAYACKTDWIVASGTHVDSTLPNTVCISRSCILHLFSDVVFVTSMRYCPSRQANLACTAKPATSIIIMILHLLCDC